MVCRMSMGHNVYLLELKHMFLKFEVIILS